MTPSPMRTRWADEVTAERVLPEYPRPQLVRPAWQNLNGEWDYAIRDRDAPCPETFDGKILVPFCAESLLGGVTKTVGPDRRLWYRRRFHTPDLVGDRLLLHFGAVDWKTEVSVDGNEAGSHEGGFDPFTFEITEHLTEHEEHEIVVSVWDPTDSGPQPRGKQVAQPKDIFYTPVTGIWQTVWLEPVPRAFISRLEAIPDVDAGVLRLSAVIDGLATADRVRVMVSTNDVVVTRTEVVPHAAPTGARAGDPHPVTAEVAAREDSVGRSRIFVTEPIAISIPDPRLWSPVDPFLYDLQVELVRDGQILDRVTSYFGMRKIAIGTDTSGHLRMMLNDRPVFQCGVLDQGYWPDGLYTPPTEEAMLFDLETIKAMGFNMVRKHVKVEPARWYHHCDRLGLLVWQDFPTGDEFAVSLPLGYMAGSVFGFGRFKEIEKTAAGRATVYREIEAMVGALAHFPSIVAWVPHNEGWGQFDTNEIIRRFRELDPNRLVDGPSWFIDRGEGDMRDYHVYFRRPSMWRMRGSRCAVLGEFGGFGHEVTGHTWPGRKFSYFNKKTPAALAAAYDRLMARVEECAEQGLAASVYTQITDVEGEVNGLLTYDRAVAKLDTEFLAGIHRRLTGR